MTSNLADIDFIWLREVYSTTEPAARVSRDCPAPDALWEAAAGEGPLIERLGIIDHIERCQACAEGWRVAMRLGARPRISSWAILSFTIRQDLRSSAHLVVKGARWLSRQLKSPGMIQWVGATAPIVALLIIAGNLWPPGEVSETYS